MHFSIAADAAKPLKLTYSYQVAFLETADFATHQFDVRMGTGEGADGTNIVINGNPKTAGGAPTLSSVPMMTGFQNFAWTMDFDKQWVWVCPFLLGLSETELTGWKHRTSFPQCG